MKHTTGKRQPIKISLKNIDLGRKYRSDTSKTHTIVRIIPSILRKSRNMLYFQRTMRNTSRSLRLYWPTLLTCTVPIWESSETNSWLPFKRQFHKFLSFNDFELYQLWWFWLISMQYAVCSSYLCRPREASLLISYPPWTIRMCSETDHVRMCEE